MRFAFILFYSFFTTTLFAQTALHGVNLYTTKDGLSNNLVTSIKQDSRGFLWIATNEGLNRFDGFQFKKYFYEKNNPSSLTHNNVADILEYKYGQLLIGTGNGLSVLNTLTGEFENQKIKFPDLKQGSGNQVTSLYKDKDANIWVNHNGELDLLDSNLNYLHRVTDLAWAKKLKGILISCENWQTDQNNRLWLLSDTSGINIIDLSKKTIYNTRNNPEQLSYLRYPFVRSFLVDEENHTIWYAPWGEALFKYDMITKKEQQINFGMNKKEEMQTINSIVRTSEGNLVCGIGGKCFTLDPSTLAYNEIPMPSSPYEVKEISPITILKTGDRYWVGAYQGLMSIDNKKVFENIPLTSEKNWQTGECTDICFASTGKIYSTYSHNLFVEFDSNRDTIFTGKLPGRANSILVSVAEDMDHRIWIGSTSGMFLFDEKRKTLEQPSFLPIELRKNIVNVIYTDSDGSMWIGTRFPFALYHYYPADNRIEKINNDAVNQFAVFGRNSRISAIIPDKYDNLWMTSRLGGGIICYKRKEHTWTLYPSKGKNYKFLQQKGITSVVMDTDGLLWFGNSFRDGLVRYNYQTDSITTFTRSDGLLSDYIQNIYDDKEGRLWLTTEYGITAFNKKTLRSESNIVLNGITGDQSVAVNPLNNEMVIGVPDHLVIVHFMPGKNSGTLPIPLLDKITVNNQQQFFDAQLQKLSLNYEQKNIDIDFTTVDFSNNVTRFAFKLSGVDKDWKYTDGNRSAQYSILSPGHYSFMVKTGNDKDVWSEPYELFSFTIQPPWWKTWWFVSLCIAVAGVLFIAWIKLRERNIKNHATERAAAEAIIQQAKIQLAAQQHKMAEAEMLALRAQMNPHFLFNSLNSINNYILKNDADNAAGYLTKFSRLMRLILDNSRSNWILLQNELKALELYIELEAFRFDYSFTYEINVSPDVSTQHISAPPMIIQPYVENAIWHGLMHSKKAGAHLQIDIYKEKENLCITIKDNGVGRQAAGRLKSKAADNQKSHGMKITAERLEIMNKVYNINANVTVTDVHNDNTTGTEVLIKFKYSLQDQPEMIK